jgi:FOG: GGDEF domain
LKKFAKFQKNEARTTVDDGQSRLLLALDRSSIRVALMIVPTMLMAFFMVTTFSRAFIPAFAEPLSRHIAREVGDQPLNSFETLKIIRHYNLAWCYVTDANDNILPATAAFAPPTRRVPQRSQTVKVRDQSFYESVVPLSPGRYLHVGLGEGEWFSLPNLLSGDALVAFLYAPIPMGTLLALFVITWLVVFFLMESIIGLSLRLLGGSIDRLSSLVDTNFTEVEIKEATNQKLVPQDFRALGLSLAILMRKVLELKEKDKVDDNKWMRQKKVFQTTENRAVNSESRKRSEDYSSVESGVFAVKFDRELSSAESSGDFAVRLLDGVHETYSDVVDYASFLSLDRNQTVEVETCLHLDDDSALLLKNVNHRELLDERNITKKSIDIGPMLIKKLGFEELANKDGIGRIVYLPFYHDGKALGFLAIFIKKDHTVSPERLRSLERFRDRALPLYQEHRLRESQDEDRWTDPITGMGNKTFFQELMPRVISRAKVKDNDKFSFLLLAPEFNTPDLARFPAEMHDRWFAEIGQLINGLLPVSKRLVPERGATNYLIRYQEHTVAIVLEGIGVTAAVNVAEGIRNSVANKAHWTGGASDLIVSAGVSMYPRDGNTVEEIISRAAITLAYVREKLGGNTVIDCRQVPPGFKPKEASEIAGTLGVLDCAGLLQSIATSSNTGILIVENELGEQFFISWLDGEPRQATLGDLTGVDAVIEFITTFKNGQYTFQQRAATDGTPSDLHSLEHCLMESALAEDKMNVALKVIPNVDVRIARLDNVNAWGLLQQDQEITPKEVEALRAVYGKADGNQPLSSIFDSLSHIPTAVKWRASGLLLQYNLVSMTLD